MSRKLYSPADEPKEFLYRAQKFVLAPNTETVLSSLWADTDADQIAEYALKFLAAFGVREVFGDDRDAAIKAEAEKVHTDWLCDVAGVPRPKAEQPHVTAAKASLVKRGVLKGEGN